ncbi:hypothetical protein G7046_g2593 [Stylonectria norvegica]|nr:hypothetical protein G7046_g2593 [Stylonectria norvegica]
MHIAQSRSSYIRPYKRKLAAKNTVRDLNTKQFSITPPAAGRPHQRPRDSFTPPTTAQHPTISAAFSSGTVLGVFQKPFALLPFVSRALLSRRRKRRSPPTIPLHVIGEIAKRARTATTMPPQIIHLPDGQTFTVKPVFAGLGFKSHELNTHPNAFPIGWTVVLNTEEADEGTDEAARSSAADNGSDGDAIKTTAAMSTTGTATATALPPKKHIHSYGKPTLQGDNLFISSIANPSSTEFKPAASPTRQIAMMLWITLYWYFQQAEPAPHIHAPEARDTPVSAKPRGEWRINIKRDGVLRGRNLIPKLERMGLLATADTAVGTSIDDNGDGWAHMFVSRRMFWQLPGRLFLFSLQPNRGTASFPGSPTSSRPSSPDRGESPHSAHSQLRQSFHHSPHSSFGRLENDLPGGPMPINVVANPNFPVGPFFSSSHLPTYYPPAPLQYVFTDKIRHPLRPKPPRMGEVFYTRYVPSVGQYLSFRVASASPKPVPYLGPVGDKQPDHPHLATLSDTALLQKWMAKPRVSKFWGEHQPEFLTNALNQPHSFPVIGQWDGVPFGYFEIYWVKEDILGQYLGGETSEWDRGLHVLIGEEWARGRVPVWLTGLVHWCLTSDYRTMSVALEPRVDNARFLQRLEYTGFSRERQLSFPHKQSWFSKHSPRLTNSIFSNSIPVLNTQHLTVFKDTMSSSQEASGNPLDADYIRQCFLRGQLAPAFNPPQKTCPSCKKHFRGIATDCLVCRKAAAKGKSAKEPDTYLDVCAKCNARTLHLGPGWCVDCFDAKAGMFPLYCEECVTMQDVPVLVKDDCGGTFSLLGVESLWCTECGGVAESWMRLPEAS